MKNFCLALIALLLFVSLGESNGAKGVRRGVGARVRARVVIRQRSFVGVRAFAPAYERQRIVALGGYSSASSYSTRTFAATDACGGVPTLSAPLYDAGAGCGGAATTYSSGFALNLPFFRARFGRGY